ncbi:MAG: HAD family hydrolase [Proteobacteria bacterium]|nr:HAD family hydrolase [Pseudomonadota bacterium]
MSGAPAVFLDRDGTINAAVVRAGKPYPPASLGELVILPGAREGIAALRDAGFRTIVVTNQPDVANGKQRREVVEAINGALCAALALDDVRVCYHADADRCACRKPKPGLLLDAARDWRLDLGRSFMIGDRWRDVDAGRAAGCRTVLIESGYAEQRSEPDFSVSSLAEACTMILHATEGERHAHGG